jgi:hypothetical protein
MPRLKLEIDSLSVVSYVTAPEVRDAPANGFTTRTQGCTQTTACSYCTLVVEL